MKRFHKYKFRKYDKKYEQLFSRERLKLRTVLGKNVIIEHIGSTAVFGLGGKGIIDILIVVSKGRIKMAKERLEKLKFEHRKFSGDKNRLFFRKVIKNNLVHVQLTWKNFKVHKGAIAVRNYLIKYRWAVREYEEIKKSAVKHAKGDGEKYRKYKKIFLEKLTKKALKEFSS